MHGCVERFWIEYCSSLISLQTTDGDKVTTGIWIDAGQGGQGVGTTGTSGNWSTSGIETTAAGPSDGRSGGGTERNRKVIRHLFLIQ